MDTIFIILGWISFDFFLLFITVKVLEFLEKI